MELLTTRLIGARNRALQRGSATVLVAALGLAAILMISALALLSQAAFSFQRAATAADLAALAAADAARGLSAGEPCQVAAEVATRQRATLVSCAVLGPMLDTVQVSTSVQLPVPLSSFFERTTAQARAGPPSSATQPVKWRLFGIA